MTEKIRYDKSLGMFSPLPSLNLSCVSHNTNPQNPISHFVFPLIGSVNVAAGQKAPVQLLFL